MGKSRTKSSIYSTHNEADVSKITIDASSVLSTRTLHIVYLPSECCFSIEVKSF